MVGYWDDTFGLFCLWGRIHAGRSWEASLRVELTVVGGILYGMLSLHYPLHQPFPYTRAGFVCILFYSRSCTLEKGFLGRTNGITWLQSAPTHIGLLRLTVMTGYLLLLSKHPGETAEGPSCRP